MSNDKFDVFLSSSQNEFARARKNLSKTICNIPFLNCIPLENSGADTIDVLEASLKGVRACDIYVGIFGKKYSDITSKEYREAIDKTKPCLNYVKIVKQREKKLEEFIINEIKSRFKIHWFTNNQELISQVDQDLRRFIIETMKYGFEVRAKMKKAANDLVNLKYPITQFSNALITAKSDFNTEKYLECLIKTKIIIESALRLELKNSIRARSIPLDTKTIGQLVQLSEDTRVITANQALDLRDVVYKFNAAIHQGTIPTKEEISWVLDKTKRLLYGFNMVNFEFS